MAVVEFVTHPGDILYGIPDLQIAVVMVDLIANAIKQQGRMVFDLEDDFPELFELCLYLVLVVIVKAVPLMLYPESQHYRESMGLGLVEYVQGIAG